MAQPIVISIVGRPNVGKSSLFNRIAGKRIAVVNDMPGVTRDRNYTQASWAGQTFTIVDTGGLLPTSREAIPEAIHEQVAIAIKESTVVLFMAEAGVDPTDLDMEIARQLRRTCAAKTVLVVNKAESSARRQDIDRYRSLGLGDPMPVSALHGTGVGDVLDTVLELAADAGVDTCEELSEQGSGVLRLAVVGRPNAGKSSLVNRLLGENRMIVDTEPGTTRDAIDSRMSHGGAEFVLIDTAGLRKKSHVKQDTEYFSNLRALQSIERADICVLVIDVVAGIGVQDLRILRKIFELRKGVLVALNKWDILPKDHRTFDILVADIRREYMELRSVPVVSISALTGQRVTGVLEAALKIRERMALKVPSSEFEDRVFEWVRVHPHPAIPEKPMRFLGARQVVAPFPLFRFFVTNPRKVDPSYERYLINKIYETYDFQGCPVVLDFRPISKPGSAGHSEDDGKEG